MILFGLVFFFRLPQGDAAEKRKNNGQNRLTFKHLN